MTPRSPRFVSAQPDTPWFVWQCHVYLHNFIDLGVSPDRLTALFAVAEGARPTPELVALQQRFPAVDVDVVVDRRDPRDHRYSPSIQPHLIERWLRAEPARVDEPTLFHDSDVALRWLPDFDAMLADHPDACLLSDADRYIGYDYLHGAGERIHEEDPSIPEDDLIGRMAAVVGIDPAVVAEHRGRAGGAQYLLTGVGPEVWAKIYADSLALHDLFESYVVEHGLQKPSREYLQVWTAGMWAYLWNLWGAGRETVVHPDLAFLFGAADLDDHSPILHIAGKTEPHQSGRFDKVDWHGLNPIETVAIQPYVFDHHDPGSVAEAYGDLILDAAGVTAPELAEPTPARHWRLLSWCAGSDEMWDVEHVHIGFDDPEVAIVERTASGFAGPGFEPANAFDDSARFWGGRARHQPGCRPELWLAIELDRPAIPSLVTLTHAGADHRSHHVLLQRSDAGDDWRTVLTEPLSVDADTEVVLHRPAESAQAAAWRLVADDTTSGFAWDVGRLEFHGAGRRRAVDLAGSGDAGPAFAIDRLRVGGTWGGRPDYDGVFHLTASHDDGITLDRIVLVQGAEHWAPAVTLLRTDDGVDWHEVQRFDDLEPGRNDLLLDIGRVPRPRRSAAPPAPVTVPVFEDPFADRRILVAIASYRDRDVAETVRSALTQAAYPEHVRFAICHQFDDDTADVLAPWAEDPRFWIDAVPHAQSEGACWARHRTFEAYDDEPYLLQIDAHTRFAARWDVRYVEMLESIDADRPLLTSYPPGFTTDADGRVDHDLDVGVQSLYIDEVRDDLTTFQKTQVMHDRSRPVPSPTLAAGQIFTRGRFCRDVPYDPKLYFAGEEISLAARAFTHGYDLFAPNENLIWHRYDHDQPKHWEDDEHHGDRQRRAVERLRVLFQGDQRVLGRYGLGAERPLSAFERHAGVRLSPRPTDGPLTIEVPASSITPRDDYDTFVVVFLDTNGDEVHRCDLRDPAVLDGSRSTVTLRDLGAVALGADRYLIVPTRRNGAIGPVVARAL
ncbi:MAG: GlcNAc-transferase family protein [Actinomycetota bacterium]